MSRVRACYCVRQSRSNDAAGPSELKLQITISTDKTVADLKQAIAEKSDVTADRQRLIYSGAQFTHLQTECNAQGAFYLQDVY